MFTHKPILLRCLLHNSNSDLMQRKLHDFNIECGKTFSNFIGLCCFKKENETHSTLLQVPKAQPVALITSPEDSQHYEEARQCVEELALYLKPLSNTRGTEKRLEKCVCVCACVSDNLPFSHCFYHLSVSDVSPGVGLSSTAQSILSRPMQRKLVTLVHCQLVEEEGRVRAMRAARSLGERTVTELILQHQNQQQLSSNLWAAVRARGCQFLGPGW